MQEIGRQYPKDDQIDKSGFLKHARLHQSEFRALVLNLPYEKYGNYLTREDAEKGKNFYEDFEIFDAVKKYRKYNVPLYANMLRSEHIPFNFFIPFNKDKVFCQLVFNDFFDNTIKAIDKIKIEFAPKPKENYLNDGTSFDAYIEYTHIDNKKGIIGIEVKYTEKEYGLVAESKQAKDINNENSKYYSVSESCKLYKPQTISLLITDKFRQIWRNQLLGESILIVDNDKFKHFTSLTLFPKGNVHFIETSKEYIELLTKNNNNFLALTYEDFFSACKKHCPDTDFRKWLDYLTTRYIVTME